MIKKGILIAALLVSHQAHASFLSFTASASADNPVNGWLDGNQDFSPVPVACCSLLSADVLINTVNTGFSVTTADSYEYTYESAATIAFFSEGISTVFSNVDIIFSQSRYDYSKIYFRNTTQTGSDDNFTYSAGIGLTLIDYNTFGLLNGNNLLSSIITSYDGDSLNYSESQLSLDPNCTIFCSAGFEVVNGGGVNLTAIETTVVPVPGALGLFVAGLTSLIFYSGRGRREKNYRLVQ